MPYAGPSRCDAADLTSRRGASAYGLWPAGVLPAAATERMVDCVHRYTSDNRPLGGLVSHLVPFLAGLHERLVCPSAACDDAYGGPALWG